MPAHIVRINIVPIKFAVQEVHCMLSRIHFPHIFIVRHRNMGIWDIWRKRRDLELSNRLFLSLVRLILLLTRVLLTTITTSFSLEAKNSRHVQGIGIGHAPRQTSGYGTSRLFGLRTIEFSR
jgi:hypothetical protein